MKNKKEITEIPIEDFLNDELYNERTEFVIGGSDYENVINKKNKEKIIKILDKIFDYNMAAGAEYYNEGYNLLKQMGEEKIIKELDSKEYMIWCPWE